MTVQTVRVNDVSIEITRKRIKHLHLRVHAPDGRVRVSAPRSVRMQDVEAFVASRLEWIRRHQDRLRRTPKRQPTQFTDGECHSLWGRSYLLTVVERGGREGVSIDDGCMTLLVRPGSDAMRRARVMQAWHKSLLSEALPPLIQAWQHRLEVQLQTCSLQRMKTRWGTCNPRTKHIRLNTELVTKPSRLLEYVVVHELVHLIVPDHGPRFVALMNLHYPTWRDARAELNGAGKA